MTHAARTLLDSALQLSDEERAELASELIASLDGAPDGDWEQTWLTELDRRVAAAEQRGERGDDWRSARERILTRLERS
jgi:hypothetical protein